jgi:glycosyltransferase involved in cell wall biosynthesis
MRIAYPMRVDATDKPGGDVLQVRRYIAEGKRAGKDGTPRFEGVLLNDLNSDLSAFDLVHLTNIDRPVDTYRSFLHARAAGKPIVLSSIHHSYEEIEHFEREGRKGMVGRVFGSRGFIRLEYLRSLLRSFCYPQLAWPTIAMMPSGMLKAQSTMLAGVDRILVLTQKEKRDVMRDFGEIPESKFVCIRNGFEGGSADGCELSGERDIDVCMVGRIEARKNQLTVLNVLQQLGIRGAFIGGENKNHHAYCNRFHKMLAASGCEYMGAISHEETLRIMRRSRVHVSASWFEVLSLVDLEAYWAGCGVVSSRCGGTGELLEDEAVYIDPGSEESIRDGIRKALDRPSAVLADRREVIAAQDTWNDVGERLTNLYREVITNHDSE